MGKKSKFKKIRKIAAAMPVIQTRQRVGEVVKGEQVLSGGVKEIQGVPVEADKDYRKTKNVLVPLNHNRKMKKLYYMAGVSGVNRYINAVKDYQKKATAAK